MKSKQADQSKIQYGVLNELIGYRLRRAQMTFFNRFSSACSDLGITPGLFGIIEIVRNNPGLTQTAVAQALGNDRSYMVAAIDQLEKMKLIERRPAEGDRRSYALSMTRYGETFYALLVKKIRTHEKEFDVLLKPGEKEWLLDMLARIASVE